MAKRKTMESIERQIDEVQQQIIRTKARYDKLSEQLLALNREKEMRQAEIIIGALSKSGKSLSDVLIFLGVSRPK